MDLAATDMEESISAASSVANMKTFDRPTAQLSLASSHISLEGKFFDTKTLQGESWNFSSTSNVPREDGQ